MKTLALANGDLVVGPVGHATISGNAKIRQELALALGEDYGSDRFHPDLGSILVEYLGEPIDAETEANVRAEIGRVIQQYISIQQQQVLQDHLGQRASRFDASDVVTGVLAISATVSFDSILASVSLLTQAGETITLNRTVQA